MEGISDIKICGLDPQRPPRIRKAPYIDLFFSLSHQAPALWCDDFNHLASQQKLAAKISAHSGLIVESWVRKPEDIEPLLAQLKTLVSTCTDQYIERIRADAESDARGSQVSDEEEGEQGRLNRIVSALDFSD